MEANPTIKKWVNDDPISGPNPIVAGALDNYSDHFVTHDQWIANWDLAVEDLEIRPADTAMGDPDEHLASAKPRECDVIER